MPWVRIDEHALNHVKILALSHPAFRLWVEGLAHCQKHLTDGLITRDALRTFRYQARARVDELTRSIDGAAPLWEASTTGFVVHDYLKWNESRDHVIQARSFAKQRLDRHRKRVANGVANAEETPMKQVSTTTTTTTTTKEKNISSEPRTAPEPVEASPSLLVFPTIGAHGPQWHLREAQAAEWRTLFPAVDVLAEARKALAWLQANPTKRKTAKGMPRFLVGWLTRCVDHGGNRQASPAGERRVETSEQTSDYLEQLRRDKAAVVAEGATWKFSGVANG